MSRLIARIKDLLRNEKNVIEIEKLDGDIPSPSSLNDVDITNAKLYGNTELYDNVRIHDKIELVSPDGELGDNFKGQVSLCSTNLYKHVIQINSAEETPTIYRLEVISNYANKYADLFSIGDIHESIYNTALSVKLLIDESATMTSKESLKIAYNRLEERLYIYVNNVATKLGQLVNDDIVTKL